MPGHTRHTQGRQAWFIVVSFPHFILTMYYLGAGWGFVHQSKCGQFKIVIDDTKHVNRPKFKSMYVKFWRTWLKPVMKFSLGWFLRINSNSRLTVIDQPFKDMHISQNVTRGWVFLFLTFAPGGRGQGNSNFYNLWLLMIPTKGCPHQVLKGRRDTRRDHWVRPSMYYRLISE